jgi:hypothetical protein
MTGIHMVEDTTAEVVEIEHGHDVGEASDRQWSGEA